MSDRPHPASSEHLDTGDAARRFCLSPEGSEEQEEAAAELLDAIARERGIDMARRGGSVASVRVYLRRRSQDQGRAAAS